MDEKTAKIIEKNKDFWERKKVKRPPIGFRIGSSVPYQLYPASKPIQNKKNIEPEDIDPKVFLPDYERLALEHTAFDHDILYGLDPFMGVPWTEAIIGAKFGSTEHSAWPAPTDLTRNRPPIPAMRRPTGRPSSAGAACLPAGPP